jgi:hypothetical protein
MSFEKALAERLRWLEEHDEHENKGYWYPSQMFFCDRSAILQHAGTPEVPKDDISLRRLWLGNKIHEAIQEVHPFQVIGHEVRVRDDEYKVSGKMDTLSIIKSKQAWNESILEVQEYKSINSRSFSYNDLPKEEHVLQVGVYLLFGSECPLADKNFLFGCTICMAPEGHVKMKPTQGRIIYISKDDLRIAEFIIVMTPEMEDKIRSKLRDLEAAYQKYLLTKELPDKLPMVTKKLRGKEVQQKAWQTRYCGFRGTGQCCGDSTTAIEDDDEPDE